MDEDDPREALASALEGDAAFQESGDYDSVGERYDDVLREVSPFYDAHSHALSMGFHFWDCWVDARNHNWSYYDGVGKADWPKLARRVASGLRSGLDPVGVPTMLLAPGPTLRERVATWFRGRRSTMDPC